MKNTEKGITLVALIITIVILLILAVVAISGIENNDLITKVDDAVGKHDAAKAKEDGILDGYTGLIDKYLGGNTITGCTHYYYTSSVKSNGDGTLTSITTCEECGTETRGLTEKCSISPETISDNGNGTHSYNGWCGTCGYWATITGEACTSSYGEWEFAGSGHHTRYKGQCSKCGGGYEDAETGYCSDANGDGNCDECSHDMTELSHSFDTTYDSNGDGTHTHVYHCTIGNCGYSESYIETCYGDGYYNEVCSACGGAL